MKNRLFPRFIAVICLVALLSIPCSGIAGEYPTWKLEGKWHCYYAYDIDNMQPIVDEEYYTFWGISGVKGQFRYENNTTGKTYIGDFYLIDYEYPQQPLISFVVNDGEEEFVFEFIWGPDAMEFSLAADDSYLAHFMKQ